MRKFLEEYGFVILIAIVVILLVVMASPIGSTIKVSVLNIVDSFGSKTVAKIDKADKEVIITLKGSELIIESKSETDKYIAILRGYQGGKEVSVASTDNKLICTDNMTNTATFDDATGSAETADGIAKFIIENGLKLDQNTKYYIEIMNIGTGERIISDAKVTNPQQLIANINFNGLVQGDFSSKGNLVTINDTQYRVLEVNGTQVKVLSTESIRTSSFNTSKITVSFGNHTGLKYADSALDHSMITFYNNLPSTIKKAIVPQTIYQSMYSYINPIRSTDKITEIEIGQRFVYALDVDDVIDYLGEYSSGEPYVLNEMFFNTTSLSSNIAWLRSVVSGNSNYALFVNGNSGRLNEASWAHSGGVYPAFVLDLSLLG